MYSFVILLLVFSLNLEQGATSGNSTSSHSSVTFSATMTSFRTSIVDSPTSIVSSAFVPSTSVSYNASISLSAFETTSMLLSATTLFLTPSSLAVTSYFSNTSVKTVTVSNTGFSSAVWATSSIHPATRHLVSTSFVLSSVAPSPTHVPGPQVIVACEEECMSLRKRLYAAAVFAILFSIASIFLGVLLYRQHKISQEYKDDPSLSRLI